MPREHSPFPLDIKPSIHTAALPTDTEQGQEHEFTQEQEAAPAGWLDRAVKKIADEHRLKYGELAAEHPAQQYIDQLVKRIPLIEGKPLHVFVSPDWGEVNASAFPDGTVFISRALIEQAETEEGLLGIITHEYVHIFREHTKKTIEKSRKVVNLKSLLETISQKRMHEYEADVRGVLLHLRNSDISPIGYKMFLEKVALRQRSGSIAHGFSRDRVLNIADASFAFHFPATEYDLHPVSSSALEALKSTKDKHAVAPLIRQPIDYADNPTDQQARREARARALEQMRVDELPLVIKAVFDYTSTKSGDPDDEAVLQRLVSYFFTKHYGLLPIAPEHKEKLQDFALEFFCGADLLPAPPSALPTFRKKTTAIPEYVKQRRLAAVSHFSSLDNAQSLRQAIEETIAQVDFPYALESTDKMWLKILHTAHSNNVFGNWSKGSVEIEIIQQFIKEWSGTLEKLSARFDTGANSSAELFQKQAWDFFGVAAVGTPVAKKIKTAMSAEQNNTDFKKVASKLDQTVEDRQLENLGDLLVATRNHLWEKEFPKILQKIKKLVNGKTVPEVGQAMGVVYEGMQEASKAEMEEKAEEALKDLFNEMDEYIILDIFRRIIQKSPEFASLASYEQKLMLFAASEWNGVSFEDVRKFYNKSAKWNEVKFVSSKAIQFRAANTVIKDYETWMVSTKEVCLETTTEQQLVSCYQLLLDEDYFRSTVGLDLALFSARVENTPDRENSFVSVAVTFLSKLSLVKMLATMQRLEAQGVPIQELLAKHNRQCGLLVVRICEAIKQETLETVPLSQILSISRWIVNPFLRAAFERYIQDNLWQTFPFEAKLDLVFPSAGQQGTSDIATRERFIEHDITTREQFAAVKKRLEESTDELLSTGRASIGLAALLDLNLEYRSPEEISLLLKGLLTSSRNDLLLKRGVYELVNHLSGMGSELKGGVAFLQRADTALELLYSASPVARHLFLRKLLASAGGVLPDQGRRRVFLKMLFEEWISPDKSEQEASQVLKNIEKALSEIPEWELLYMGLQNFLRDKIANPPDAQGSVSWAKIWEIQEDFEGSGIDINEALREAKWNKIPSKAKKLPHKYQTELSGYANGLLRQTLEAKNVLLTTEGHQQMTPIRFIKEIGSKLSAVGVRFLQNLPLIAEIPEHYAQEFSEIYDQVQGQSKLAALALLEDQWPALWSEVAEVGGQIGGGSVVTVYEMTTKDGNEEVVKVLNPNIRYHLQEIYRFGVKILELLAKQHGGSYQTARLLLDDIKEWIDSDIGFEGFLEQDASFRDAHQNFQPKGFEYKIYVPQSKGPANKYFSREEKVVGTNLTQWDTLVKQGRNMKEVVSLVLKSYVEQIRSGRALSDVHPGNFSVTEDNRVVIYDRNFFLNLSSDQQALIASFLNPGASATNRQELLLSYFGDIPLEKQGKVRTATVQFAEASVTHDWKTAQRALIEIKKEGVKIPLTFTLLLKNFHALQLMARRAGFQNGIFDAFVYQP